ncbi:UPF0182 family protein [Chthonomonas calidirosea]|uniref:UPF0182 family membrane protein n=1 Tax=Chthonomonas calidirosea TaxID=454171 RepID=UPI0006EC7F16|nr:UPF0182 family protein [Chthonomonas calidirosea]CEK20176.1 hypothetical protein CP488_02770 [Chthonomonas calidirosea]
MARPHEPEIIVLHEQPSAFPRRLGLIFLIAFLVLFGFFLVLHNFVPIYTDWLWFREVGYPQVFFTEVISKSLLYFAAAFLFFVIFFTSVVVTINSTPDVFWSQLVQRLGSSQKPVLPRLLRRIAFVVALILCLWAGRSASDEWNDWLLFTHGMPFHQLDPVYHKDIGFYVFQLPFLSYLQGFFMITFLVALAAVIGIGYLERALNARPEGGLPQSALRPAIVLIALLALTQAFGTQLGAYGLLQHDNGIFVGADYVDVHYRLFAIHVEIVLLIITAVTCLMALKTWRLKPAIWSGGAWLAATILLGGVVPQAAQTLQVAPNQFGLERPYIQRNIQFTRSAYGLEHVLQVNNFPAALSLNASVLEKNRATLDNVRLWDYKYLAKVYQQIQAIKPYYRFEALLPNGDRVPNIDIDRYLFQGHLRQVMLAAREMDVDALPESAQTWQNRRLSYTHGYGVVMSPVNQAVDGDPVYLIEGFPPKATGEAAGLTIAHPQIYYGMLDYRPVYVDTQQPEFDYPATGNDDQDHYAFYQGHGGIRIGNSLFRKLLFAYRLNDWNLLLIHSLTPNTRVLWRRDIRERVQLVAPFLQQDTDPYLVIDPDNGHLVWVIDGYTLSDRYPYATPRQLAVNPLTTETLNYIRNSVKATVDAYSGRVNLYLADPSDPIAQAYSRIFPGIFHPLSDLSPAMRAHLRYPEDLFRIQRAIYAVYHVDDPRVFYLREDVWAVPDEPLSTMDQQPREMEPYYVVMHLPDLGAGNRSTKPTQSSRGEEFVLMSPLSPIRREDQNILGWMCARCDPPHYGQLVLYRFPQQVSVLGPTQVLQRINSDPVISPQLSLLRAGGSTAEFGNLLVIPIDHSLLYIAPLYVEATSNVNRLPKLAKVVVAYGDQEVMANSLDQGLALLFPGYSAESRPMPSAPSSNASTGTTPIKPAGNLAPEVRLLIQKASALFNTSQQQLRQGDFAGYGQTMKQLQETLTQLKRTVGVP